MEDVNYDAARFWWDVIMTCLVAANFIYTWIASRTNTNMDHIVILEGKVGELSHQVERLKTQLEHAPKHRELGDVHEKINDVSGQVKNISGQLKGIEHTLNLLNEYMLHKEKP